MAKKPVKAFDWNTIAADLAALAQGIPGLAALVIELIGAFKVPPQPVQGVSCDPCPQELHDCLVKHLQFQRDQLVKALADNVCTEHHLDECCPGGS